MYRQGSSIVLEPHSSSSSCKYQFLVTRNPSLLQPDPQAAAAAAAAAARARGGVGGGAARSSSKGGSWWVSAGALFAAVSAVMALAICYMSSQLWARYKVSCCFQKGLVQLSSCVPS